LNEEQSGSVGAEELKTEEPHREESVTSGTALTIEVSQSYQITKSTVTNSSVHTQSRNLGISMADEMSLPIFRGDGFEDPNKHWFLCEVVWIIKKFNDEEVKRAHFSTTLRNHALSWYMKFLKGVAQPKSLNDIKIALSADFKNPSQSHNALKN
jgi:hypothetical protein